MSTENNQNIDENEVTPENYKVWSPYEITNKDGSHNEPNFNHPIVVKYMTYGVMFGVVIGTVIGTTGLLGDNVGPLAGIGFLIGITIGTVVGISKEKKSKENSENE